MRILKFILSGCICTFLFLVLCGVGLYVFLSNENAVSYDSQNVIVIRNLNNLSELNIDGTPSFSNLKADGKIGLLNLNLALDYAATDDRIKGIVIDDANIQADFATISEVSHALKRFSTSGKFVVSHFNMLSQKSYLLASGAGSAISMNAEGLAEFHGIASSSVHIKSLLQKAGLSPVVVRCGKFKGAVEPFILDQMSNENREQKQQMIKAIWQEYETTVLTNRSTTAKELNLLADSVVICTAQDLLKVNLIDTIQFADEFWTSVKTRLGLAQTDKLSCIPLETYVSDNELFFNELQNKKPNIAVVVAQGDIDMGKSDEESIGSETYVNLFKEVREDSTIQAVLFRINSGGGSALASELIWREVALTQAVKPVVVSMGDYAASGGYYIATPAQKIVASPMTLTGSIGVFGLSFSAEELLKNIGVNVDYAKTHQHSDFNGISRQPDSLEINMLQKSVDKTYSTFIRRVSEGRNIPTDKVAEIAQGRVWSARRALELGLIDEIGSLNDALAITAMAANIQPNDVQIAIYPRTRSWIERLSNDNLLKTAIWKQIFDNSNISQKLGSVPTESGIYAQNPYIFRCE